MVENEKLDTIKKLAVDNFARYLDESIAEYMFLAGDNFTPSIEQIEYIWETLKEHNECNISQFFSNLVRSADTKELIETSKKKRTIVSNRIGEKGP